MFLLVIYGLFLILPFASRNIAYRTATLFAAMTMVINTASMFARLSLPSPDPLAAEAFSYFFGLFLPVFLGCSLIIGATILPMATLRETTHTKKVVIVVIGTVAFLYLSDIAIPLAADLFFSTRLRSLEYYFIPDFQRVASARWDYIYLTANLALAASATIAVLQRWSRPL